MDSLIVIVTELATKLVVPAILTWLGAAGARWIQAQTGNTKLAQAMLRLADTINTVVAEVEQTVVPEMRSRAASGKLGAADMAAIKQVAVNKVKQYLGDNGLNILSSYLKLDETGTLDFIAGKIEAAVLTMKSSQATPALPPFLAGRTVAPVAAATNKLPPFLAGNPA